MTRDGKSLTTERWPLSVLTIFSTGLVPPEAATPLPAAHTRKLKRDLAAHGKRLEALEASIRAQEIEAEMHRTVLMLGQNAPLLEALGRIHDDTELSKQASSDPQGFARSNDVELPAGTSFGIDTSGDAWIQLSAGDLRYEAHWDPINGFTVTELTEPSTEAPTAAEPTESS